MKHSLVYRFIMKFINGLIEYYNYSVTKKVVNIILLNVKIAFSESFIYKMLVKNANNFTPKKSSFIIQTFEKIINWIVKVVNSFVSRGLKGSIIISLFSSVYKVIKESKSSFVMNVIISATLVFDIYSIVVGTFTYNKIIFTFVVIALFILNSCTDILTAFKESFIRKSIAKIFEFNFEE